MEGTKLVKAVCAKTNKHFGLEVFDFGGTWKVVNFIEMGDLEAKLAPSEVKQDVFYTNENLQACRYCGNRKVGGCGCIKNRKRQGCAKDMAYEYQCIYCDELHLDYSLPTAEEVRRYGGDTLKLEQNKDVKIITFSNVEWKKFDNIQRHPSGTSYHEPKVHVLASEKNIEFHGYNVSQMDEGVYYNVESGDGFVIECDVDTTTISPHPGGFLYIDFGAIKANINQSGGAFFLDGKNVGGVGAKFHMRLSVSGSRIFEVRVDGRSLGTASVSSSKVTVKFGFQHSGHCCHLLSHAYLRGIKMEQGLVQ